jgi:two-component system, chemotaxis family, response regulator Rcp1
MLHRNKAKPIEILLVEDSRMDIKLTQEALQDAKIHNRLHVVMDGDKALDFLYKRGEYVNAPRPDIILLDLNLPRRDGREVLADIKQNPALRRIPVVILTTSQADEDILRSYDLHVNCYITKPVDMHEFLDKIRSLGNFWLSVVSLPQEEE